MQRPLLPATLLLALLLQLLAATGKVYGHADVGANTARGCRWVGTAPFCGTPTCPANHTVAQSDNCGNGHCCATGYKILCCPPGVEAYCPRRVVASTCTLGVRTCYEGFLFTDKSANSGERDGREDHIGFWHCRKYFCGLCMPGLSSSPEVQAMLSVGPPKDYGDEEGEYPSGTVKCDGSGVCLDSGLNVPDEGGDSGGSDISPIEVAINRLREHCRRSKGEWCDDITCCHAPKRCINGECKMKERPPTCNGAACPPPRFSCIRFPSTNTEVCCTSEKNVCGGTTCFDPSKSKCVDGKVVPLTCYEMRGVPPCEPNNHDPNSDRSCPLLYYCNAGCCEPLLRHPPIIIVPVPMGTDVMTTVGLIALPVVLLAVAGAVIALGRFRQQQQQQQQQRQAAKQK